MIEQSMQLGEPVEFRGVVVAPLFPRNDPQADYLTLQEGESLGFRIAEIDEGGSVPELLATNPLDRPVLLYDSEELHGLKQHRILNLTVLVAAKSESTIPVACVEQGRWDSRSSAFTSAPHTSYPELRRDKAEHLSASALGRSGVQRAVWRSIADKAERLGVSSPTSAAADIYRQREQELASLRDAFPPAPGQSGAMLALGDGQLCLDYLSRPQAFAALYPKLLAGYMLDALERLDQEPASTEHLAGFLEAVAAAPQTQSPSPGTGEDLRLASHGVVGSGLLVDTELVQLCAYTPTTASRAG
jgi:hypothetical protein